MIAIGIKILMNLPEDIKKKHIPREKESHYQIAFLKELGME
jgi:hypothetical protein